MTTAQEQPVSMTEINTVLEDNTFPEKLDWEADFTVRHTCTASTILAGCVNRFCRFDSFSDC